ncbi:MAG: ATP-binding protein, partial [Myxococcales bacterium]|nr:ATP-binding protein [Myxococcales bacterium]
MVRDAPLLLVDVPRWLDGALHQSALFAETLNTLLVEATLRDAVLYLDTRGDERLEPPLAARLEQALSSFAGLCVVAGHRRSLDSIDASDATTEIAFAVPEMASRAELWRRALAAEDGARAIDCAELASQFALTGGQIEAAVGWAIAQHGGELSTEALRDGARRQVSSTLATLAERVEENSRWEDVVLPAELRQALDELRAFAVQRRAVFDDWGFGRRFSSGRGLTALFHGPPGTGKTLVAAILARELGLELFRIDLSRVVSKWVGETEKNLARVFDAAEHAQALLLF